MEIRIVADVTGVDEYYEDLIGEDEEARAKKEGRQPKANVRQYMRVNSYGPVSATLRDENNRVLATAKVNSDFTDMIASLGLTPGTQTEPEPEPEPEPAPEPAPEPEPVA